MSLFERYWYPMARGMRALTSLAPKVSPPWRSCLGRQHAMVRGVSRSASASTASTMLARWDAAGLASARAGGLSSFAGPCGGMRAARSCVMARHMSTKGVTQPITAKDILKHGKNSGELKYVVEEDRVADAAVKMIKGGVGSLVVKDSSDRVVGFLTQRDVLRCMVNRSSMPLGASEPRGWNVEVGTVMTKAKDLVYLSPEDTLEDARALVSISGKRHVPVLSGSTLLGVISPKDIARCLHLAQPEMRDQSAKTSYVSTVMNRKGMPLGTRLRAPLEQLYQNFAMRPAVANLPHPHKGTAGEDAFLLGPHMIGVADGVGSWWEGGIDPAIYARTLMHESLNTCTKLKAEQELSPGAVLDEAWAKIRRRKTIGSSTVCLVALHPFKAELIAANVGDSGFLLLRRQRGSGDAEGAIGTLDAYGAADSRKGGSYYVAFRSPQQLRGFNAPYQLGRAPDSPEDSPDPRFETPQDADLVRVPVRSGDIVVLATDGLFDNMPENEVLRVVEECEGEDEERLSRRIALRAQELSLDRTIDSPFAILAKDNDIMWGGGRPDDITVIACRISERGPDEPTDRFTAFAGPGPAPEPLPLEDDVILEAADVSWD